MCTGIDEKIGASMADATDASYTINLLWKNVESAEHVMGIHNSEHFKKLVEEKLSYQLTLDAKHMTVATASLKVGKKTWWVWVLAGSGAIGLAVAAYFAYVHFTRESPEEEAVDIEMGAAEFETTDLIQANHWRRADNVPLIGSGTFGIVYLSQNTLNGVQFCTKEVDLRRVIPEETSGESPDESILDEQESRIRSEIQLLAMYRHPRIVSYLGCEVSGSQSKLFIFMEYLAGGTLKDNLKRYGHMDERLAQMYMRDVMEGLKFLHTSEVPVIHRDIKPANILLTLEGRCKLADFGCIEIIDRGEHSRFIAGTRLYAPPEMIDTDDAATPAFDVWSLAVTLHKMLTNVHVWPPEYVARPRQLIEYQRKVLAEGLPTLDHPLLEEQAAQLISSMLVSADSRPSIAELETHPFFQQEYGDPSSSTPVCEAEKRRAALDKLTRIRHGRAVSVTVDPDRPADSSSSVFDLNRQASTKRRARLGPEDRPKIDDIQLAGDSSWDMSLPLRGLQVLSEDNTALDQAAAGRKRHSRMSNGLANVSEGTSKG